MVVVDSPIYLQEDHMKLLNYDVKQNKLSSILLNTYNWLLYTYIWYKCWSTNTEHDPLIG